MFKHDFTVVFIYVYLYFRIDIKLNQNMSQELLDIEDIVRKWALDFPLDKGQKKDADDIHSSDINWQNVRITHGKTDYFDEIHATKPKSHILLKYKYITFW